MKKRILIYGIVSGIIMGVALFIGGAFFSRIIYGPQFAPPGKFEPEQINAFYFVWTKILIGMFFGILFTFFYEKLPLSKRLKGPFHGLKYGFFLWLVFNLWDISHPLVYGSIYNKDQLFWLLYSICGFLALGFSLGVFYKKKIAS
jgi:hypothetical protein